MTSEDLLLDIMHQAHTLGLGSRVLDKVEELTRYKIIYDSSDRTDLFEKAFKTVIHEYNLETENKGII